MNEHELSDNVTVVNLRGKYITNDGGCVRKLLLG